jgi:hypothetical protein
MELNELYDHLWNVGVLLQLDNCLQDFLEEYRPWPKLHEGDMVSTQFYARLETNKVADMAELNDFRTRKDVLRYTQELRTQLALFGTGIKKSLQRTMGHYLQVYPAPANSPLPCFAPLTASTPKPRLRAACSGTRRKQNGKLRKSQSCCAPTIRRSVLLL